ncbi:MULTISPECIES: hypothetical protein [Burkholderia]|uniref:Uncharacterized protein n=1 Tax=Burkholderia paludis TaxID=1506587 RepID=A0A6J5F617_9BURK|nr:MULTISPECIES: hypothetical protein [Burkholderia]CAB3773974.1 hypothetical protein LMG30113_07383 [Burkholderia paludis]VWC47687.1 hypothetical protein BPA30113_07453 [Burkholderia paludis]
MSHGSPDLIHIHEDDWGLRSLHPVAVLREVSSDIEAARDASQKNQATSGVGWTDLHIIQQPSTNYAQAGLRLADVVTALSSIQPRVKRFYATASAGFDLAQRDPYGSYDEDAWCFGRQHCYLKVEVKDDLVTEIWFDISSSDAADADALRRMFEAIDRLVPGMVADYCMDAQGLIADREFLDMYFQRVMAD